MPSTKTKFVCQTCGYEYLRWVGKCPGCGEWNTMVEELEISDKQTLTPSKGKSKAFSINEISSNNYPRIQTGINELDRVLGGGLMSGSTVLIAGDPGIGKSTLILQALSGIKGKSLYVTGEESIDQIKSRADRVKISKSDIFIVSETALNNIIGTIEELKPEVVVIDSIQTIYRSELNTSPGSIGQIRECTTYLMQYAKKTNIIVIIIGHITKDGSIAGPKALEHIVDAVLQFEGEKNYAYRIIRTIKNRFGSTNEIGIFEMQENGLSEVSNPSAVFLSERGEGISGSAVTSLMEGTRPILVEVQALATRSIFGIPQRVSTGFDIRRLSILLAVLEKRLNFRLGEFNVVVNIAGGVTVNVPDADLALCAAIVSSIKDVPLDNKTCLVGEVGLGGEIRSVYQIDKRISEAEKLGFERMLVPASAKKYAKKSRMEIISISTLKEALDIILKT